MEMYERLVEFRKRRGLTQDELAKEVGVSRQTVSKWERGLIAPSGASLIALGRVYGISVDELATAAVITIVSAFSKESDPPKDDIPIMDQNDVRVEDIDLTEVIFSTDGITNIEP